MKIGERRIAVLPFTATLFRMVGGALLLLLVTANVGFGKTLLAIVSDRSAADLAAGADEFHERHQSHQLVFRSHAQFSTMSDTEAQSLLDQSDAFLAVATFGDDAVRLQQLLSQYQTKPILAISSSPSLVSQSRDHLGPLFRGMSADAIEEIGKAPRKDQSAVEWINERSTKFPRQKIWIQVKAYWHARGQTNLANMIALLFKTAGAEIEIDPVRSRENVRLYHQHVLKRPDEILLTPEKPWMAIIDHDRGDSKGNIDLINQLCASATNEALDCVAVFALWGESSTQALTLLETLQAKAPLAGIISLQDFVIGGGEGREMATQVLSRLNVPVFKGLRLTDRTRDQWELSEDGLPWNTVHYRIAMPEVQGVSQPLVLATATKSWIQQLTGLRLSITQPLAEQTDRMVKRVNAWHRLRTTSNAKKRVAIVYYNHPPGRHNIGADNLDVPASLWHILTRMEAQGYDTGELPPDPQALLDLIQERGVNLPEQADSLRQMSKLITTVSPDRYRTWFTQLPDPLQAEMEHGPLGYLHERLRSAIDSTERDLAVKILESVMGNIRFVLDGATHASRDRAKDLLAQLEQKYRRLIDGGTDWSQATKLSQAVRDTSIEGLRGWGTIPGRVMVHEQHLLIPGIRFGNVFIGPQPPRGWELNEELLHANTTFPPTHQYLAFYAWLREEFQADSIIHLGRHSTYEFLPRHSTGVGLLDYSWHIAGETPGVYPYIVDGVGEGIQAKRRGLAVMVSHLTPPLSTTELYDDLLGLRQLVETFEAADPDPASPARIRSVAAIREQIDGLNLRDELAVSMADELSIRGIRFEEVDDDLLVHETGHYLTKLQENYMPLGLHVFGKDWTAQAVNTMMASIVGSAEEMQEDVARRQDLVDSPKEERRSLFNALAGGFVSPGKGNDPIRTPEVLPTGRNFHALDGSLLPTRLGFALGKELATKARLEAPASKDGKEAVILWASDAVRDEGAMVAFGLNMLGIEPVWNSRGILTSIQRGVLANKEERRDVVFVTSGLFRDLYGGQLEWLDKAVLLALDGASETIRRQYPSLRSALEAALEPLGPLAHGGNERLQQNRVAAQWVKEATTLLATGALAKAAGREASLRIFGTAPGFYGAGVNTLVERSGAWEDRSEIAQAYLNRMGHAYGVDYRGERMQDRFQSNLKQIEHTYLGRASNLYGLLDNNDAFDYLGGLSLAVESLTGTPPKARIVRHADPKHATLVNLDEALMTELRGQFLNPVWLGALMKHDYAGARTMGSEFLEYLWGWQVTNPEIISSAMWDEVKSVYLDDRYDLGLDSFLEQSHNVHVKTNMLAVMLVAAQKGFWKADERTLNELSAQLTDLIIQHGLPGSGHTRPDHPVFDWMASRLDAGQLKGLHEVLAREQIPEVAQEESPAAIAEIETNEVTANPDDSQLEAAKNVIDAAVSHVWILLSLAVLLLYLGIRTGRAQRRENT
ncbi:MAG: hypothetical protein NPIRA04_19400 [Nitrospirales bacterium]|nr:MAG: hypothetical protein NPIRA04_19400 [Nitrospirales bacterium]